MSAFESQPEDDHRDAPAAWPAPEPLFPAYDRTASPDAGAEPAEPRIEPTEPARVAPPEPVVPPEPAVAARPAPRRKRSFTRGALALVQLLFVVVFMAALVAALVGGALLLLTMALRAAVT